MEKTCILFAGQGSQYTGMGVELAEMCPDSAAVYRCGSEVLGFDLLALCQNGDDAELAKTCNSQPAIFATSLAALKAVMAEGIEFGAVAGHSLGEYAALVASGMVSIEQGFELIKKRAHSMDVCARNQNGAMCAVIGVSPEEIVMVCEQVEGYVVPVNYNSPVQTVIAGEAAAVDAAAAIFAEQGKKAVKLAVSAAFHSKLMEPGADMFYDSIKDTVFAAPKVEFYSNVTGGLLTDFADMPTYLRTHLVSPVRFADELVAIQAAGYTRFIECGPNKVLTGLVKKTLSGVTAINVENAKTLAKLQG